MRGKGLNFKVNLRNPMVISEKEKRQRGYADWRVPGGFTQLEDDPRIQRAAEEIYEEALKHGDDLSEFSVEIQD